MTFWLLNDAIYDLFKFLLKYLAFVKKQKPKNIIYTLQIWNIFYSPKKNKKNKKEYFELFPNIPYRLDWSTSYVSIQN